MQYSNEDSAPGEEPEYEGLEHSDYLSMWREWADGYQKARKQSFRDQEYYDGDVKGNGEGHWLDTQLKVLADRNQAPITFNLVKRKINAIAGVEQRSRAEPRGLPRTPKDQYAAEVVTDSLRYLKEQTRLPMTSANGFMDALIAGYTASEIKGAADSVTESLIEWRDFFFDPRSRYFDFTDARFLGIAKWIDQDVAIATYAGPEIEPPQIAPRPEDPMQALQWAAEAQAVLAQYQAAKERRAKIVAAIEATAANSGGAGGTADDIDYEDHPIDGFGDPKRKRVFIVDMWHQDPRKGWFRCVFTGQGKLFTQQATLIEKDQWGKKTRTHPIKAFSLYVSKNGWRYGEVRGLRSPQDEVNSRRSKALHLLTLTLLIYEPGVFQDGEIEKVRGELKRPDGVIEARDVAKVRLERNIDLAAGQQRLGEEARAFMEMEGPNPQLQGEQGRATSGRAVLALQQAGLGQLGPIFDRFHDWEDRRYRAYWFRVQQFWTAPMYVRVTDDKNAAKFAAVNGAHVLDEQGQPKRRPPQAGAMPMPQRGPGGQPPMSQAAPMIGHNGGPAIDPAEFETGPMLAELDMDIIIDRAPEAATLQAEQFESLSQMAQAGVLGPPNPEVSRLLITASALPNKSELLDMLDKQAQAPKQPDQGQMLELKELAAKIELLIAQRDKTRAETAKTGAEIPKVHAEAATAGAEARTANVDATMNEIGASNALMLGASAYGAVAPPAAAETGALGLPPSEANGPPPV